MVDVCNRTLMFNYNFYCAGVIGGCAKRPFLLSLFYYPSRNDPSRLKYIGYYNKFYETAQTLWTAMSNNCHWNRWFKGSWRQQQRYDMVNDRIWRAFTKAKRTPAMNGSSHLSKSIDERPNEVTVVIHWTRGHVRRTHSQHHASIEHRKRQIRQRKRFPWIFKQSCC